MKPIRVKGYTITTSPITGPLAMCAYQIVRDSDGKNIGGGGISRLNYQSAKDHRLAVAARVKKTIAYFEEKNP